MGLFEVELHRMLTEGVLTKDDAFRLAKGDHDYSDEQIWLCLVVRQAAMERLAIIRAEQAKKKQ